MRPKIKNLFRRNGHSESTPKLLSRGSTAPDFSLIASNGRTITLSELRGKTAVLVFYPADESPVCSNQLALYNEALHLFEEYDAQILGISTDDVASHQAFADSLDLRFPLLADDDPAGFVTGQYGVLNSSDGRSERALYVVDPEGIIVWSHVSPRKVNPGAHGILRALESLPLSFK